MREPWEDELAKVDRLQPSEDVRERVGRLSPGPQRDRTGHRVVAIAIASVVSLAAGLFAWTAFRPSRIEVASNGTSDIPQVVRVVCAATGTEVSTPTVVGERGLRFEVENPGDLDEVIIAGRSGEPATLAADIDLSSGLEHTFSGLPPGGYVLGCYADSDVPRGLHDTIVNAPGMQPFEVMDPNHYYVSPVLQCDADGRAETNGFIVLRKGMSYADAARTGLVGLESGDIFEPSGYVALVDDHDGLGMYRIVRGGNVIGNLRLLGEFNFGGDPALSGFLQSCRSSSLGFENLVA